MPNLAVDLFVSLINDWNISCEPGKAADRKRSHKQTQLVIFIPTCFLKEHCFDIFFVLLSDIDKRTVFLIKQKKLKRKQHVLVAGINYRQTLESGMWPPWIKKPSQGNASVGFS